MGWFRRDRIVRVEFFDADSGKALYRTDSPVEQLPASFAQPTSVQIEGVEHDVIRAEPAEAAEFAKSRHLRLWVRKRVFVPLNRILFSLPTIADRLPPMVPEPPKGEFFDLHEDDWRQVELVSAALADVVDREIGAVRRIHEEARVEWGWSRMHVRRHPVRPLGPARVPVAELRARFRTDLRTYDGVRLKGEGGVVEGGFAFETGSLLTIYGQEEEGHLRACGLVVRKAPGDVVPLVELCRAHELLLVDWCRAERLPPEEEAFRRYLGA